MSDNENDVEDFGDAEGGEEHAAADLLHIPEIAIPDGIDPATANLLKMQMTMMQTLMATQLAQMEKRLDYETRERRLLARELAKRDSVTPKIMGKAPLFDMEKDRDNFETWKLKWKDFLVSSNINAIEKAAVKEEQMKAALTAALSNDTLKWLNGQGFSLDDLGKADFIIEKIDEHIQGTTNPYVQVVELIGRKKSSNESFDHFVTDVCERVKRCALDKVTNVTDWFTTMIVVANHDDVEVRKKLLLQKDLKLDKAKAICKEEEKAAKTSQMLGASRTSSGDNYGASQVQTPPSAAATSSYQSSRGRGQFRGRGGQHGGRGGHQQQERGRSQSRGRSESRDRSGSRDREGGSCYRCGNSHQGTCPAIDKKCSNCQKIGHYARACRGPKATTSTSSAASASLASLTIASACNPDKLELVEVEIENIDGKKEKIKALPDTGANITAFEPEILPKLGLSVDNLVEETKIPKSADGSALRTLGSVQVRISKSGRTTEFVTAYIIKNLQQPILSRQVL